MGAVMDAMVLMDSMDAPDVLDALELQDSMDLTAVMDVMDVLDAPELQDSTVLTGSTDLTVLTGVMLMVFADAAMELTTTTKLYTTLFGAHMILQRCDKSEQLSIYTDTQFYTDNRSTLVDFTLDNRQISNFNFFSQPLNLVIALDLV